MKICPGRMMIKDLVLGLETSYTNYDYKKFDAKCIGGRCGAWITDRQQCAVTVLAQVAANKVV